ncbi:PHD finger protein 21B [Grus japonensis]|uniref:PHD finger protein 21B n=1 Tax=Grus japonensis TaxID=30415 RepID=A0ABC9VV28_GRUJA
MLGSYLSLSRPLEVASLLARQIALLFQVHVEYQEGEKKRPLSPPMPFAGTLQIHVWLGSGLRCASESPCPVYQLAVGLWLNDSQIQISSLALTVQSSKDWKRGLEKSLGFCPAFRTTLLWLPRPTFQVRPKTLIPDSLPISPCRDQPSKQPPTFQKATVVSIKNPSPALPTANNTVSHVQTPNSQSQSVTESTAISSPLSSAGVAYAIISTSPNNATPISTSATVSVVNDSIKVQPLLISADSKVIIIQPQVQTQTESKVETKKPPEESAQGPPATKKKKEENPENEIHHDEHCTACKRGVNLQPCGTCPRAYHLNCLDPPLKTAPKGVWVCPKCQQKVLKKDDNVPWTGTLAIVHSYVTHKTVKEEEKRKLLKRSSELKSEHRQLEEKDRRLNNAVKVGGKGIFGEERLPCLHFLAASPFNFGLRLAGGAQHCVLASPAGLGPSTQMSKKPPPPILLEWWLAILANLPTLHQDTQRTSQQTCWRQKLGGNSLSRLPLMLLPPVPGGELEPDLLEVAVPLPFPMQQGY